MGTFEVIGFTAQIGGRQVTWEPPRCQCVKGCCRPHEGTPCDARAAYRWYGALRDGGGHVLLCEACCAAWRADPDGLAPARVCSEPPMTVRWDEQGVFRLADQGR